MFSVFGRQLFNQVKEELGADIIDRKVHPILGDVTLPDLGISPEDRKFLAENVTVVYHMAATIRFDEALKKAVMLNTRGTKFMLQLAKEMKKLQVSGGSPTPPLPRPTALMKTNL